MMPVALKALSSMNRRLQISTPLARPKINPPSLSMNPRLSDFTTLATSLPNRLTRMATTAKVTMKEIRLRYFGLISTHFSSCSAV